MTMSNTISTTTQQINTLLTQLSHSEPNPAYPMLFAKAIAKARLDYTPDSIHRLSRLLTQITQKNYTLEALLAQQGSRNFFLAISAYLANYLAISTDEPIVWLNFNEALTEIAKKNREYGTDFQLDKDFDNSLIAKIGEGMFCRPLQAVHTHLVGEETIDEFVEAMQTSIFERSFIDITEATATVGERYLAKIHTGRLRDTTIGFFDYMKDIHFDFSEKSLTEIDTALAKIRQDHAFSEAEYQITLSEPANQAFCYLLGFYLGTTTAKLAKRPIHWASYSQLTTMLREPVSYSIEHSFVMVSENHYHTPILAITNQLFGLTADYPGVAGFAEKFEQDTAAEFAHPTAESLLWYPWQPKQVSEEITNQAIPHGWQMVMQEAGRLLAHDWLSIYDGGALSPNLYAVDMATNKVNIRTLTLHSQTTGIKDIEQLYFELNNNPNNLPFLVASYDSQLSLTTQSIPAIVLEIRVYQEPKLTLQLVAPYRHANEPQGFAIFPLAYHAQNQLARQQSQSRKILLARLPALVNALYLSVQKIPASVQDGSFLDNYYHDTLSEQTASQVGSYHQAKTPAWSAQNYTLAEHIDIDLIEPKHTIEQPSSHIATPANAPNLANNQLKAETQLPTSANMPTQVNEATLAVPQPSGNRQSNAQPSPELTPQINTPKTLVENKITPIAKIDTNTEPKVAAKQKTELIEQLRQDQLRLQSELATSDSNKDKKLMSIAIAVVAIILVMILMSKLLK